MATIDINNHIYVSDLTWFAGEFKNTRELKEAIKTCPDIKSPFGLASKINNSIYNIGIISGGSKRKNKLYSLAYELYVGIKNKETISSPIIILTLVNDTIFLNAYTANGLVKIDLSFDNNDIDFIYFERKIKSSINELSILSNEIDIYTCTLNDKQLTEDAMLTLRDLNKITDVNIQIKDVSLAEILTKRKESKPLIEITSLSGLTSNNKKHDNIIYIIGFIVFAVYFGSGYIFPEKIIEDLPPISQSDDTQNYSGETLVIEDKKDNTPLDAKLKEEEIAYLDSELALDKRYLANMQYSNPLFNYITIINKMKTINLENSGWIVDGDIIAKQEDRQFSPENINYEISYNMYASDDDSADNFDSLQKSIPNLIIDDTGKVASYASFYTTMSAYKPSMGTTLKDWRKRSNVNVTSLTKQLKLLKKNEIIEDFVIGYNVVPRKSQIRTLKTIKYELFRGWLIQNNTVTVDVKAKYLATANRLNAFFKQNPAFNLSEITYNTKNNDLIIRGEYNVIQ